MDAVAVLNRLTADGIRLEVRGGTLLAKPKDSLTDELRALIVSHKPELVHLLLDEAVDEATRERAAILEVDGGHTGQSAAEIAELAGAYYSHHWSCPACRTGTQAGAKLHRPCPEGARLWDAYCEAANKEPPC